MHVFRRYELDPANNIFTGVVVGDPSASPGIAAGVGSVLWSLDGGYVYRKFDDANTDWLKLAGPSATIIGQGAPDDGVAATLTINPAEADNSLVFTSVLGGVAGNAITIEYVDPATGSQALSITVVGTAITVNLATDEAGVITTTGDLFKTALLASAAASALVTAADDTANDGSGLLTAMTLDNLASGVDGTGQGTANRGALYVHEDEDTLTNPALYINRGNAIFPVWAQIDDVGSADTIGAQQLGDNVVGLDHLATDTNAWLNTIRAYLADGMLQIGTLLIDAVPEKFQTTTDLIATIGGVAYAKVATTALVFSASMGTINLAGAAGTGHWGVFLVQFDGTNFTTKHGTYSSGTDQDYATEAAAIAVLPAPAANNVQVGYITVQVKTGGLSWTPITDDLTPTSDCTTANFYDLPAAKTLPAVLT